MAKLSAWLQVHTQHLNSRSIFQTFTPASSEHLQLNLKKQATTRRSPRVLQELGSKEPFEATKLAWVPQAGVLSPSHLDGLGSKVLGHGPLDHFLVLLDLLGMKVCNLPAELAGIDLRPLESCTAILLFAVVGLIQLSHFHAECIKPLPEAWPSRPKIIGINTPMTVIGDLPGCTLSQSSAA
jgi:hypothetical protein